MDILATWTWWEKCAGNRAETASRSSCSRASTISARLPQVREAFEAAAGEEKALIIDLSSATFVDSSILGAVLDARRHAGEAERGFAVACDGASEPVRRVLEVTGLAEELPVHPNREAALEALAVAPT